MVENITVIGDTFSVQCHVNKNNYNYILKFIFIFILLVFAFVLLLYTFLSLCVVIFAYHVHKYEKILNLWVFCRKNNFSVNIHDKINNLFV